MPILRISGDTIPVPHTSPWQRT